MDLRVAYVTYREEPERPDPDIDIALALPALARVGVAATVVAWDDPAADWSAFDAVLIRSVWDYVPRYAEFMAWARGVAGRTRLLPPLAVIEHNTDKRYLRALEQAGVPIVPTFWVEPGDACDAARLGALGWPRIVVKPTVSSGSRDTIVTTDLDAALAQVDLIRGSGRGALVQPYLDAVDSVDAGGEVAVMVLGGRASHAVRKVPALTVGGYGDASEAVEITPDLAAAAARAVTAEPLAAGLAWLRVDLVRGPGGGWHVMELELTEPLLFLGYAPGAPDRFAAAVLGALAVPEAAGSG